MKKYFLLIFSIVILSLSANGIPVKISGVVKNTNQAKYAYLVSKNNFFLIEPLIDGRFSFEVETDLSEDLYRFAFIFLDENKDISEAQVNSKLKEGIWILGRENNIKNIVLENITLEIADKNNLMSSKIISGGALNKQLEESINYTKNNDLIGFIKKYPDSPISIYTLNSIIKFYTLPGDRATLAWGVPLVLYNSLSNRLKETKLGKDIKRRIEALEE